MKAYRYISLSTEQLELLQKVHKTHKKHHVRQRCHVLLLSHQGYKVPELAIMFNKHCDTIREWYDKWEREGLDGLLIKAGRGVKAHLDVTDESLVELVKKK